MYLVFASKLLPSDRRKVSKSGTLWQHSVFSRAFNEHGWFLLTEISQNDSEGKNIIWKQAMKLQRSHKKRERIPVKSGLDPVSVLALHPQVSSMWSTLNSPQASESSRLQSDWWFGCPCIYTCMHWFLMGKHIFVHWNRQSFGARQSLYYK